MIPRRFVLLLLVLLAHACSGDGGDSGACAAGTIEACTCVDGSRASRVCTDDRVWSPCACRERDTTSPSDPGADEPEAQPEPVEPAPEPLEILEPVPEGTPEVIDVSLPDPGPEAPPDVPVPDQAADEAGPEPFEIHYPDNCEPQCGTRECGPDGCGGTCGTCGCGHECQQGTCSWIGCDGRECGDSGCPGVSCGGCYAFANSTCTQVFGGAQCACTPDCAGRQCGDNGCGGTCGTCQAGLVCTPAGKCMGGCDQVPTCGACGSIACVNASGVYPCGTCLAGMHCSNQSQCVECLSSADCTAPLACLASKCVPVAP